MAVAKPQSTRRSRPQERPLTLTPAARRILDVAGDLFYTRGINTVGMELVAERAEVTKKTIYDRFGSKQRLVVEYLRERDARWRAHLTGHVERADDSPRARVAATYDALDTWMGQENQRGCAMVNAYAELSDPDHPGRAVAEEQKRWLRDLYTGLAARTGAEDPRELADALAMLHEGAVVARNVTGVADAARIARSAADALVTARMAPTDQA
ncbi:TetR/AcrR family transcriptional regulator [Nocardiopsis sp. NRRL B-16309]|uniref:TetR/AcrR family transcriptional regulator n=1 Tax=Nocardiopsis sp. NRRL B-16309 TaxID=1519494 RepID=UPI0006AFF7A4|nr:TetR/AcrR family transcriptional regulator [Nocardiopsis sp. NRRL B-16309]KOX12457.1 TetR family transcriptional regulator [Nocardiopsis sp. NRRL B-16309]